MCTEKKRMMDWERTMCKNKQKNMKAPTQLFKGFLVQLFYSSSVGLMGHNSNLILIQNQTSLLFYLEALEKDIMA